VRGRQTRLDLAQAAVDHDLAPGNVPACEWIDGNSLAALR
jgi:hypothetical protein